MILTVTMNPAVDITYTLPNFELDTVNRSQTTQKTAGGKGINVARVIHLMNKPVLATGVIGGTVGDFIATALDQSGIAHDFLRTKLESRNCIAILHEGAQTEILEEGPTLTDTEESAFLSKFATLVKGADLVTISGSLPKGLSVTIYQQMIVIAHEHNVRTLLDCSGAPLKTTLSGGCRPFLIKPNLAELNQLLQRDVGSENSALKEALSVSMFSGIPWIVVSLGADGALVKAGASFYRAYLPKVSAVNPVGSGDATVAGLAVALMANSPVDVVIKTAMTAGLLNALEATTGYITYEHFEHYFHQVSISEL